MNNVKEILIKDNNKDLSLNEKEYKSESDKNYDEVELDEDYTEIIKIWKIKIN